MRSPNSHIPPICFSLDPAVTRTYFVTLLSETLIKGFDAIAEPGMTRPRSKRWPKACPNFTSGRNRFLDHLLARFGDDFGQ